MNEDFLAYLQGRRQQFNPYSAGSPVYGGGRSAPNIGASNKAGYRERDNKAKGMREALLRRLQAKQKGKFASPAALRPQGNLFPGPGGF